VSGFPERQDRGIGGDALENLLVAEIDDGLDGRFVGEQRAQLLAGAGAEKVEEEM
jgi:hypothetical protein